MDEFFDRFDFKRNTAFEKYLKFNFPETSISRQKLIIKLFNEQNTLLYNQSNSNIIEFLNFVTDSVSPIYLNYSDDNWFAELKCKVIFKNKPQNLKLILKVEQSKYNTFHWAIVSAQGKFLETSPIQKNIKIGQNKSKLFIENRLGTKYFLSPVSHGIDFANIFNVFYNKNHVNDYIYNGSRSKELNKLISLIKENQIKFVQIDSISYHLIQINGWILTLNYFNRNAKNSGWLINNLLKVTSKQKGVFLKSKLNVVEM